MKNEENDVQTDRKETLKVCARFYTELYSSRLQDPHPSLNIINPDSSQSPTNHDNRSQENPERNKKKPNNNNNNNKARRPQA